MNKNFVLILMGLRVSRHGALYSQIIWIVAGFQAPLGGGA
jgi:hypothetical protein